jgi:hypothetical protein
MKKILIFALVLFAGSLIALSSCSSTGKIGGTVEGDTYKTEGWVDDDTFRIAASCAAMKTLENVVQRKESAKRCATLNAEYQIIEKFVGSKIEGAAGMKNFELTGMAVSQELKAVVKGGSVRNVTYDAEQNAEVIYEVKAKGLKQKVSAGDFKAAN